MTNIQDSLTRRISDEDDRFNIWAKRTCTAEGFHSIEISVNGQKIMFNNDDVNNYAAFGDDYELAAIRAAEVLDRVANYICELPDVKKK